MPISKSNRGRYPDDWARRSHFVRFIRARSRCEHCGAVHGEPHPITGSKVILTTAHLVDMRPEACALLNLAALCQRCHLRLDIAHHVEQRQINRELASGQIPLFERVKISTW